ncbi:MAG: sugar phosphate isomerase/epimerase family protein [Candidatus Dormibacteria bacterium]
MFEAGEVDQLGMVRVAAELGFSGFEMISGFFPETTAAYLGELRAMAQAQGVELLLLMCDGVGDLGASDAHERGEAVDRHCAWVEHAATLGCHAIRVNAGGDPASPVQARTALTQSLESLADHAAGRLSVLLENHWGLSSDPAWVVSVLRAVDRTDVGTLPDFGNFPPDVDRYTGMSLLMPFAKAVSAKCYDFGPDGQETTIDFGRMMSIVRANGYAGHVGVEYEGERLSEIDGILAARALLERV